MYGLVNSVDEYSDLHGQINNFQSADSTSRQNGGALSCCSHVFKPKETSSKQVAAHPAGNAGTDTTQLTQFQIVAIFKYRTTEIKEDYCWPITHRRRGGHAAADLVAVCVCMCVLKFVLQLDPLTYTYIADHTCTQYPHGQNSTCAGFST